MENRFYSQNEKLLMSREDFQIVLFFMNYLKNKAMKIFYSLMLD